MSTTRILVPDDNQNPESIWIAIEYAEQICQLNQDSTEEIILFVPTKEQLKHTVLAATLGDKNSKLLHDGGAVRTSNGIPMRAETIKTLKWLTKKSVVISFYADQKMLDQVDALNNLVGAVAVPHAPGSLIEWQRRWSPKVHGETSHVETNLISDTIFEQALLSLTSSINLSPSTLHPSDKKLAERILKILKLKGHSEDAKNIKSWAIKNKWNPKIANELANLSEKIQALKSKIRLERADEADITYNRWSSKA